MTRQHVHLAQLSRFRLPTFHRELAGSGHGKTARQPRVVERQPRADARIREHRGVRRLRMLLFEIGPQILPAVEVTESLSERLRPELSEDGDICESGGTHDHERIPPAFWRNGPQYTTRPSHSSSS
jgi:hypothetical protein